MSKDHELGFASSRMGVFFVRVAFLWARVPLRAAAMDREGEEDPRVGGAKRLRG